MKPKLGPTEGKRLKLKCESFEMKTPPPSKCDVPLSNFAFKFNSRHYTLGRIGTLPGPAASERFPFPRPRCHHHRDLRSRRQPAHVVVPAPRPPQMVVFALRRYSTHGAAADDTGTR